MANCYALRPTRAETEKTAQSGTLMMRRSEVIGVVRKMLHYAYRNAETAGQEGRVHDVEIQQARMRTLIALREGLKAIPVFENPAATSSVPYDAFKAWEEFASVASGIETEGHDPTGHGAEHESPAREAGDAQ